MITTDKPSFNSAIKSKSEFKNNLKHKDEKRLISMSANAINNNQIIQNEPSLIAEPNADQLSEEKEDKLLSSVNNNVNNNKNETNEIRNSNENPLPTIPNDNKTEIKTLIPPYLIRMQ